MNGPVALLKELYIDYLKYFTILTKCYSENSEDAGPMRGKRRKPGRPRGSRNRRGRGGRGGQATAGVGGAVGVGNGGRGGQGTDGVAGADGVGNGGRGGQGTDGVAGADGVGNGGKKKINTRMVKKSVIPHPNTFYTYQRCFLQAIKVNCIYLSIRKQFINLKYRNGTLNFLLCWIRMRFVRKLLLLLRPGGPCGRFVCFLRK